MVVIYSKGRDGSLQELSRTEVVPNSLNPKWITKYTIAYHFETVQNLVWVLTLLFWKFLSIRNLFSVLLDSFYLRFRVCDVDTQFHNQDVKVYMPVLF